MIILTLTGLTPEPPETTKIALKLLSGLQGISQWAPRTPPGAQGHPRDLSRASIRVLAGAEITTEPEHFVRN